MNACRWASPDLLRFGSSGRFPLLPLDPPMPKRHHLIPKYRQTYPDTLATADELKAQGLKPGAPAPVALLEYTRPPDTTGICALYDRTQAVPIAAQDSCHPQDLQRQP